MALVKLPEGQQRSGKQGGMVWSHNRTGPYTRERAVPVNPNTDRQVDVRNAMKALAIAWETVLTQAQRDAWDTYAANVAWQDALGRTIYLTGLNHYIRSNLQLQVENLTIVQAAPTIFDIAAAELALVGSASEATQLISIAFDDGHVWCDEDDAHQWVFMGIPQNASRKYFGGPWRRIQRIDGSSTSPPTSPVTAAAAWPIAEGQRVWIQTRILRADGRLSTFAQHNFLVAA